jgi:Ribosomal protein L11 methyltransferase (PrmA)
MVTPAEDGGGGGGGGGGSLWVVPSWAQPPAAGGAVSVVMEPGLAFGTGEHPTTRLCLRWLWRRREQLQVGAYFLLAHQPALPAGPAPLAGPACAKALSVPSKMHASCGPGRQLPGRVTVNIWTYPELRQAA